MKDEFKKLNQVIEFWLQEFEIMETQQDDLFNIEPKNKCGDNNNFIIDGFDMNIIDFDDIKKLVSSKKNSEISFLFPIFWIINNPKSISEEKDSSLKPIENSLERFENELKDRKIKLDENPKINIDFKIVIISKSPKIAVEVEEKVNECSKDKLKKIIKRIHSWERMRNIKFIYSSYSNNNLKEEGHIIKSYDMTSLLCESTGSESLPLYGRLFTVRLFDLVELYNKVGEDLFVKNVRLGIKEILDVGYSIRKTLEENPEDFWFLNNGVTLYATKNIINYLNYSYINVTGNLDKVSIVNGAQTITSSAKFFYKNSQTEKTKNAMDKAYVLLKIIEIDEDLKNEPKSNEKNIYRKIQDRINMVTISLNRQKPIVQTDIVYTNPRIQDINNFYEQNFYEDDMKEYIFKIIRRGEISSVRNHHYYLFDLARVLMAIKNETPGSARTQGLNTILKVNKNGSFVNKNLFGFDSTKTTSNDNNGDDELTTMKKNFISNYGDVNFAMIIYDFICESFIVELRKNKKSNFKIKAILKFGKFHVTYFLNEAYKNFLNKKDEEKLTSNMAYELLDKMEVSKIIDTVVASWKLTEDEKKSWAEKKSRDLTKDPLSEAEAAQQFELWDSNKFKKDKSLKKVYSKIIKKLEKEIENVLKS